jgi:MinD-like ATPase involved in chromosome partitioning or flagellar assembly
MCEDLDVNFLGSIPLDPQVMMASENGECFLAKNPASPTALAIQNVIEEIKKAIKT